LVKDGATAIAALGQDIDTAFIDLKGGTTGQVLAKASGTDLDFTWVTDAAGDITGVTAGTGISGGGTSGTVTVTNSMATAIDAKGDLIGGTGADTFARLAVGTNGQILVADSAETTGLKWATVPASKIGQIIQATTTTNTTTTSTTYVDATNVTASITPATTSSKILVTISAPGYCYLNGGNAKLAAQIVRGSTSVADFGFILGTYHGTDAAPRGMVSMSYIDSPATTSATSYKLQIKTVTGGEGYINATGNSNLATIILTEITS
jgi:hypothetical protein